MSFLKTKIVAVVMSLIMVAPALTAEHVVNFLSFNPKTKKTNVFEPEFLKIAPGDTVRFVPKQPTHDSVSLDGLIPEGAAPWAGKINEEFTYTFDVEGVYAYECTPHFILGQAGVIQVGDGFPNKDEFTKNMQRFTHRGGDKIRKLVSENLQ